MNHPRAMTGTNFSLVRLSRTQDRYVTLNFKPAAAVDGDENKNSAPSKTVYLQIVSPQRYAVLGFDGQAALPSDSGAKRA